MERPVEFNNGDGLTLRGIIHAPSDNNGSGREGILFLNSGFGQRNYSHNLYVSMARRLAEAGYHVLRFDFHGIGESDGDFDSALYIEWYNDIQNGMFVADTTAACNFFKQECQLDRVVLLGICGGAITALLAAAREGLDVSASILIGLPITLDKPDRPYGEEITTAKAKLTMSEYLPKLFSLKAWSRLLTFRSDFKVMARSTLALVKSRMGRSAPAAEENWQQLTTHPAFNPHVVPSFLSCVKRKRPMLLIFAESDRLRWEFESEFQDKCLQSDTKYADQYEITIVPETNHEFQIPASKTVLKNKIVEWLNELSHSHS